MPSAIVIGAGFAGLSAACHLAQAGIAVTVLEQHDTPGGRARSFSAEGFTFDMGPSWYWMPDVLEQFFSAFGKCPADYYELIRLDPSYQVIWADGPVEIPAGMAELRQFFEREEPGAAHQLDRFLKEAAQKYESAMKTLVYLPGLSPLELARPDVVRAGLRLSLLQSVRSHVAGFFKSPKLRQLAEFPILFLGALPQNTPALYTLMNYADMALGTWYPMGGMAMIAQGISSLGATLGVQFSYGATVTALACAGKKVTAVHTAHGHLQSDVVVAAADYHHVETQLLPQGYRNYNARYWATRKMAPSSLLYYVGVSKKLEGLCHHNLFFDADFEQHAAALYTAPAWPADPLLYVCCPSRTDASVAPPGCENLFILIPTAPGMNHTETDELTDHYFDLALARIEQRFRLSIRSHIVYRHSYGGRNFVQDYNAFQGNAYGLANTLRQTAFMKPSLRNRHARNLFYAGQLTVPGPGVPPAIISGGLAAAQALKHLGIPQKKHPIPAV